MQKKRSTKSRGLDVLVVLLCLCGIGLNVNLFWKDLNRTLSKLTEQPIGTITFKRKSAQRKFIDRVLWDRLQRESPVYNGDTIRTADLSEATVEFFSGGQIILMDNSLAQVFHDGQGTHIDLSGGDVSVNTQGAGAAVVLASGGNRVEVASGGMISAQAQEEGFNLRVLEGNAQVENAAGSRSAQAGSVFLFFEDGTAATIPSVAVLEPLPGQYLLSPLREDVPVEFSWQTLNFYNDQQVRLEVAEDRSFKRIIRTVEPEIGIYSAEVVLPQGNFWWRLYPRPAPNSQEERTERDYIKNASGGKLNLVYAAPPRLIAPAEDYLYQYRTKQPAVRFLWSASDMVSQYRLDIADNPQMLNPAVSRQVREPSLIFSGLSAGTWYWQVTPLYPADFTGTSSASDVGVFIIQQSGLLESPALLSPVQEGFVNIAADRGDTYFSWKNDPEAMNYTLRISGDPSLSNPVIEATVTENRYRYDVDRGRLREGQYYWGVSFTDIEGNDSPASEVRSFLALEGEVIQRTIFPPDNYMAADARMPDIRFTWKTNLPFPSRFQIAGDSGFNSVVYEEILSSTGVQGMRLPVGTYYWRIVAETGSDRINFTSPVKRLEVVPPLGATEAGNPSFADRVIVRENIPVEFSWEPVPTAEYYQLKLYGGRSKDELLYEVPLTENRDAKILMDNFPEGEFTWTVQAFVNESAQTSRRSGLLASFNFDMKKLRPVDLLYPAVGRVYQGVEAARNPDVLRWSSVDRVASSRLVLSRERDFQRRSSFVMDVSNPQGDIPLVRLGEGRWYWTVFAETEDGLDISAREPAWFDVLPIEPLPAPGGMRPEDRYVIGPAQLRETRSLVFSWDPVPGANAYTFRLFQEAEGTNSGQAANRELLVQVTLDSETSYTVEDLSALDRGRFSWEVNAFFKEDDDFIFQRGRTGSNSFTIELPQIAQPRTLNPGELYGN